MAQIQQALISTENTEEILEDNSISEELKPDKGFVRGARGFGRGRRGRGGRGGRGRGGMRGREIHFGSHNNFNHNNESNCTRGKVLVVCCCGATHSHDAPEDGMPQFQNEKMKRRNARMEEFKQQYTNELEYLQSEGFLREKLNLRILIKNQGDLEKTVERLNQFKNERRPHKFRMED